METSDEEPQTKPRGNPSLGVMLLILFLAIAIAAGLAYLVVNPFFHQHPR